MLDYLKERLNELYLYIQLYIINLIIKLGLVKNID